ncbi:hypothetical protein Tco_0035807 [Tanacetum coccineum]
MTAMAREEDKGIFVFSFETIEVNLSTSMSVPVPVAPGLFEFLKCMKQTRQLRLGVIPRPSSGARMSNGIFLYVWGSELCLVPLSGVRQNPRYMIP